MWVLQTTVLVRSSGNSPHQPRIMQGVVPFRGLQPSSLRLEAEVSQTLGSRDMQFPCVLSEFLIRRNMRDNK